METKIRIYEADDFAQFVGLRVWQQEQFIPSKTIKILTDLVWMDFDPNSGVMAPQSPLSIPREEAQRLMDQLWTLGFRPKEGHGSVGQLAAIQTHLNRTIDDNVWLRKMVEQLLSNPPLSPIIGETTEKGRK